jgi:membrane protein implicated in regulation of membrane protease activity
MTASRIENPRRYRRASKTTGRFEVLVAVAVVTLLLAALAVAVLPWPLSLAVTVAMIGVATAGFLVTRVDKHRENEKDRLPRRTPTR